MIFLSFGCSLAHRHNNSLERTQDARVFTMKIEILRRSAQSRYVAKIIDMRCNFFENSSISGGIQEAYLQKMTENCYGSNSRPVPASHSGKEDGKTIFKIHKIVKGGLL